MGYALVDVSEVGPAEFALIAVLHESIFARPTELPALGAAARDRLVLIAHLEGNPVGFLAGSGSADGATFDIESVALLRDYRRQGLGTRMVQWAEAHARARGYVRLCLAAPFDCPREFDRLAHQLDMVRRTDGKLYSKTLSPHAADRPACPVCNVEGVEKKQKWFCPRCGQLIQTCCD